MADKNRKNTGQVIRKGERTWLIRMFVGRDPSTGKRKYFNHTIRGTNKDAQRYLNGILREKDLGTFIEPSAMTLGEYFDKWLAVAAKPRLKERSYTDYEDLLRRYVREPLGSKKLSDIRPLDIQKLYTSLQEKGLSARTVKYTHAVLSSALKQAVRWQMLSQNPASLAELPRQERKEMKTLSPEDATKFLQAAKNDKWGVLFSLALVTGMRPEEYLGLQWKDVDWQKGVVTVQRALIWRRKGGGWYFGETKTARSRRNIPLPKSTIKDLMHHKSKQAEERLKAGSKYQNLDLIFATAEGTPLMRENIFRRHFKPILKAAELPMSIRLYDLRHSCATLLLSANENPKVVSERLGHSTIVLTLDVYSHVLPSMQQAASEKLEQILFSKVGTP
ncbi:MAG: integrase family protein [bacterium]|nr:MAG: integrase family protein [bacterium]